MPKSIGPFHVSGLFLYPLKTESQRFADVFREGLLKETSDMKWVKTLNSSILTPKPTQNFCQKHEGKLMISHATMPLIFHIW